MSELKAITVYDAYWKANSVGEGTGILVYLKSEADKLIAEKDKELDRVRMEHHRERDEYISMVYSQKKEIERLESAVAALKGELYELRHR